MTWNDSLGLLAFAAVCILAASSGSYFKPGAWYDGLAKPSWIPPKWAFPAAWSLLFTSMAVSGWLVWRAAGLTGHWGVYGVFGLQLALNALWSAVFFGLRRMDFAFFELLVLWVAIAATIAAFAPISAAAAWLLAPYLAWVSFAGYLNIVMWRLNPEGLIRL